MIDHARIAARGGRFGAVALTTAAVALVALLVPALAAATTFSVNSTGDGPAAGAPGVCVTSTAGECTLRAAIKAANENAGADTIVFDPAEFKGETGDAIAPGSPLPETSGPTTIDGGSCPGGSAGGPCVTLKGPSGNATIAVSGGGSVVEHLAVEGGTLGIEVIGTSASNPGSEILDNVVSGVGAGGTGTSIFARGAVGGEGNLIEDNTIHVPESFDWGIVLRNGPNRVFGNVIEADGSYQQGVLLEELPSGAEAVTGNRIGGDTAESENVISGFQFNPIRINLGSATRNEVGRNRGLNGGGFIALVGGANGGIAPPVLTSAVQSSVSGTAEPEAKVRVFATNSEGNELQPFLVEAVADSSGNWKAALPKVATGTFLTATETLDGGTSQLSAALAVAADPVEPEEKTGGGSSGGGSGTPAAPAPLGPPAPAPAGTTPSIKISKGPAKNSSSTTAKFRFSASPASGASFECKLDKGKYAKCKAPKTYKHLKPGKHSFQVRAVGTTGLKSKPATYKFSVQG